MEIRRIMVGVDFSSESDAALSQALDIARMTGADLVLAHVLHVPDPLDTTGMPEASARMMARYHEKLSAALEEERARLAELRERISGQGVPVSQLVLDGYPDTALARAAQEIDADVVAIGTRGRTGFARFLLGSVAERVVRLTETCVLVARPGSGARGGYRKILVPTDFSPFSEEALGLAMVLAAEGATVDLLHSVEVPAILLGHGAPPVGADELATDPLDPLRLLEDRARERGRDLVKRHSRDGVALSFQAAEGPAARVIRDRASSYDLVVMGSHGRRGARRFFLGSVAELTVRHAPCSVIVVHGRRAAGAA